MVHPNEARVLQLFGKYVGSVKTPGLRYANPFYTKRKVSVRVRNFETAKLKVNDKSSNPIEIAAVVVWRVTDTAEALFEVDDYVEYVHVQSEAAVRGLSTNYPYDAHEDDEISLTGNTGDIAERLRSEIQERLAKAGVEVSPIHQRSRTPCSSASKRAPSSRRAEKLSTARSAWWRWRWSSCPRRRSSVSMRSGRPRW
jgi:regulator of protease activity HflC (stomatin/prohibitin superfamily)